MVEALVGVSHRILENRSLGITEEVEFSRENGKLEELS